MTKDRFTDPGSSWEQDDSIMVFFDEDCPACQFAVKKWNECDDNRQLSFQSCRMPEFRQTVGEKALDQIHVVHQGTIYSGVAALKVIYRILPRQRSMLWILRFADFLGLANPCYQYFARHRMTLGHWMRFDKSQSVMKQGSKKN